MDLLRVSAGSSLSGGVVRTDEISEADMAVGMGCEGILAGGKRKRDGWRTRQQGGCVHHHTAAGLLLGFGSESLGIHLRVSSSSFTVSGRMGGSDELSRLRAQVHARASRGPGTWDQGDRAKMKPCPMPPLRVDTRDK